MEDLEQFIQTIKSEFPDDRLTYQKGIPTFHPESAKEAAALVLLANKNRQRLYITGFGNNISPEGEQFEHLVTLRTDRLNQLQKVAPDDFYVVLGSGFPLRELNRCLETHNLFFPHASLPYVGSVGGAVAVGLTGELHKHDLPIKKYFIQAEVVTPEGEIITPGSTCFKSVSGYDVVKLFTGSWGLLGFITSVTFRVMPSTGRDDFLTLSQKAVSRDATVKALDESNSDTDALYSRKIKTKFDPNSVFPLISTLY